VLTAENNFFEEAKMPHKLTLLAKSNAIRKSVVDKVSEFNALDQQINDELMESGNCIWQRTQSAL
jgi:hypothetical protein